MGYFYKLSVLFYVKDSNEKRINYYLLKKGYLLFIIG